MAADFPTSIPAIQRLTASDYMNSPGKEGDVLHNKLSDEIEALAAVVGVTGSVVPGTIEARISALDNRVDAAENIKYDDVFILIGQSNADGRGYSGDQIPSAPMVFMLDKDETFRVATEPLGVTGPEWVNNIPATVTPGAPGYSFGVVMGKSIASLTSIRSLLVPCAIGSTAFKHWIRPAIADDMTTLYGAMTARAKKSKVVDRQPVVCFFGFESNAIDSTETLSSGAVGLSRYVAAQTALYGRLSVDFPSMPLLYAQLSASNSATIATRHRLTGHVQGLLESTSGAVEPVDAPLTPGVSYNTNATNTVTVLSSRSFLMVGDGTPSLGYGYTGLTSGRKYCIEIAISGTGLLKITTSGADILTGLEALSPPSYYPVTFTAGATGSLVFYRNSVGQATNLQVDILSIVEIADYPLPRAHMVVTHDVPRNPAPDDIHVSTEGQIEVGRRFALAYAEHVLKVPGIDGTGPRLVSVTSTAATTTKVKFTQQIAAAKSGESNYSDGTNSLFRVYDGGTAKAVSTVEIDPADNTAVIITHASCAGVRVVTYGDRAGQDATWRKGVVYNTTTPLPLPAPMFGPVVAQ